MMTSRGALYGADAVATVFVAEMHGTESRFAALAVAYAAARLGGLVSASWVVSPNPLSTVSLLVTLVNVSAAWAALAMPSETALAPLDGAEPPPPKLPPPQAPPPPAPPVAAAVPAAAAANPFDDDVLRDAAPSPPQAVVDGEKTPLLT
ncbi:N-methylnicotinate transmembrane transporter [Aureococcus anophagefferens]|nr:N-methylnicotinate transmembrane transporter [Aureococcus anophagefferens]